MRRLRKFPVLEREDACIIRHNGTAGHLPSSMTNPNAEIKRRTALPSFAVILRAFRKASDDR